MEVVRFWIFMRSEVSHIVGYEDQLLMGGREDVFLA